MAMKKYEQLMDLLQKDIIDGKLPVGSRLPSERELAEAAHMNRMTVRNALKHLEEKKVIISKRGSGYYVRKHTKMVDEFELGNAEILSLSAQLRQNGMEVSRHTISLQKMAVPQWLLDSFPEEQEVYELIRLSEVNDESYVLQKAYLPYSKFEDMDRFNFEQFSLYAYMEDKGYRPKNMVSMMHIGLLPKQVQEWMDLPRENVFIFDDKGYAENQDLVEYTISYYNPKHTSFRYMTKGMKEHKS